MNDHAHLDRSDQGDDSELRLSLAERARAAVPGAGSLADVHGRATSRRRRRAGVALGAVGVVVLGGLVAVNLDRSSDERQAGAPPTAVAPSVATTVAPVTTSASESEGHGIPLPSITYPRDPAGGPQPTKVLYTVLEGDTFESIAATLGMDPATVRTQTGGTIAVGQVLSLLVGPKNVVSAAG